MTTPLPFPSGVGGVNKGQGQSGDNKHVDNMRIDIPHKSHKESSKDPHQHLHPHHQQSTRTNKEVPVPPRGSSAPSTHQHHPRQPVASTDSYFPHSQTNSAEPISGAQQAPRTPGSTRGHHRQTSAGGGPSTAPPSHGKRGTHQMTLSLSGGNAGGIEADKGVGLGFEAFAHGGPPSPSTLTDIILGIHSTLYGAKRTPEEVREMVARYYDRDAVFESPLLSAIGREQIANQFIMAFTLPGMDVTSELRDVICSDFEFDGTRAGIIDQTISVTLLPSLFGSSSSSENGGSRSSGAHAPGSSSARDYYNYYRAGTSTPGYTLQSAVTPHPFATYSQTNTPAGPGSTSSSFSRVGHSQGHSPTTPYSFSNLWGSSRPHTPGAQNPSSSHIRPLSQSQRASTPPSVNGDFDGDFDGSEIMSNSNTTIHGNDEDMRHIVHMDGGQIVRPTMPAEALTPHWSAQGLGRSSVRNFLWGIFHPRAVLKHLCTIHLRLMSRLEFNDEGHIVRHEDTWGLRETIEGTIPFASLIYALERRIVGHICSFAVGRGFSISNALARHAIGSSQQHGWPAIENSSSELHAYRPDANEAAHALLLGYNRHNQMVSMARSRASSPSRQRFSSHGIHSTSEKGGTISRSRARSLVGGNVAPPRASSSDNLLGVGHAAMLSSAGYGERERGSTHGGETFPPDSSARYRGSTGVRRITTSTSSAPVGLDGLWQHADLYNVDSYGNPSVVEKTRAPDRDG